MGREHSPTTLHPKMGELLFEWLLELIARAIVAALGLVGRTLNVVRSWFRRDM